MAALNRIVGPITIPTGTAAPIYTVPASGVSDVLLVSTMVTNNRSDNNAATYSLYVVPQGQALNIFAHTVINARPVDAGVIPDLVKLTIPLAPGDQIQAKATQGAIAIIATGVVTPS